MTRYAAKGGVEHEESITITPDQFATVLDGAIRAHMAVAKEATEEDIQATSDSVVKDLKDTSPKLTGKYAKGWKSDMHHAADGSPYARIHNVKKPGLTHILEHGHGGPHPAKAKPHIEAAYERGVAFMTERMGS
ncbi:MAG: hypothetical protein ACRC75_00745 [Olsenella sp.]